MEYLKDILPGLIVALVGGAVVVIVKTTLKGIVYDMQQIFVTKELCAAKREADAEERENLRKGIEINAEDVRRLQEILP